MGLSRRIVGAFVVAGMLATLGPAASGASGATTPPKPEQLKAGLLGNSTQVLIVSTSVWSSTTGSASLYELKVGKWKRVAGPYTARLGRKGMSTNHVEGDGTTPAGAHRLLSAFGTRTKSPTKLSYRKLKLGDCWISDVDSENYNEWVEQIPCGSKNENLWSIGRGGAYANAIVTDYNMNPVVVGKGSAIFVHIHSRSKSGATKPTSGCVTVTSGQLLTFLGRLSPSMNPRVVIGPTSWLKGLSVSPVK